MSSTVDCKQKDDERIVPSLQSIPDDTLATILSHCSDLKSLFALGASSQQMKQAVYDKNFACRNCNTTIFQSPNLDTAKFSRPFSCAICHSNLCGNWVDYDKRHCKPQKCDGCGKVECYSCQQKHMTDCDGYGTENYCQECQEEFDFGMGGC